MRRILLVLVLVTAGTDPGFAIFLNVPPARVHEVPVARVLANLERNPNRLPAIEMQRAIGRLHLIAYLRASDSVFVYESGNHDDVETRVVEGVVKPCSGVGVPVVFCEDPDFSLAPPGEVPIVATAARPAGAAHLAAAIAAYSNAKILDSSHLRTRLALAFALSEAGRREEALDELRWITRQGLRLIPPRRSRVPQHTDWETHVVLSETGEHLGRLAGAPADRRLAATLRKRLDEAPPGIAITPVVVPLRPVSGVESFINRESPVRFDFTGQGYPIRGGWLTGDAGWLVWDPFEHQTITSGFQLLGSVTWMAFWENGYRALATLDDDGNGELERNELRGLAVWSDHNGDGRSDAGEVRSLSAVGIVTLRYEHERQDPDFWISPRGVTFANGDTWPTWDWLVTGVPERTATH